MSRYIQRNIPQFHGKFSQRSHDYQQQVEQHMTTIKQLMREGKTLEEVRTQLHLAMSPTTLRAKVMAGCSTQQWQELIDTSQQKRQHTPKTIDNKQRQALEENYKAIKNSLLQGEDFATTCQKFDLELSPSAFNSYMSAHVDARERQEIMRKVRGHKWRRPALEQEIHAQLPAIKSLFEEGHGFGPICQKLQLSMSGPTLAKYLSILAPQNWRRKRDNRGRKKKCAPNINVSGPQPVPSTHQDVQRNTREEFLSNLPRIRLLLARHISLDEICWLLRLTMSAQSLRHYLHTHQQTS